ncbi:MAG TPA: dehydrogenase, partial [Verrucomicrobiae bacterium]|nr:dehydrogenase [Verrucomicrobiae bacterium]
GICIYQGDQFPEEYRGHVFMGNIHQNAINHDRLIPNGSSFKAVAEKDFLTTSDGWFRPISEQVGPDGALWIGDWCDKYPCYQNARADPEGVDREHGRIWRVVYVGEEAGKKIPPRPDVNLDLGKLPGTNLVALLDHPNVWQRRTAQRLLMERIRDDVKRGGPDRFSTSGERSWALSLVNLVDAGKHSFEARLAAFWVLAERHQCGIEYPLWIFFDTNSFNEREIQLLHSWMGARFFGELGEPSPYVLQALEKLASNDDPRVRLAVATAVRQLVSGSLITDSYTYPDPPVAKILAALIKSSADAKDPLLPYMIWMASEPLLAHNPGPGLNWLAENGAGTMPLSGILARKAMRRICDLGQAHSMDYVVEFLTALAEKDTALAIAALDGVLEGEKGHAIAPATDATPLLNKLQASGNAGLAERGQRLGALWGDAGATQKIFITVNDFKATLEERTKAVQTIAKLKSPAAREAMLKLVTPETPEPLVIEALRALSEIGGDAVGEEIVERWKSLTPAARRTAAETLTSRSRWAGNLLSAVERKVISASELSATAIRAIASFAHPDDEEFRRRFERSIGRIRSANADKQKIIAARKEMILGSGPVDAQAGHELAKKTCLVCHKLYGEGADVGPDLTGVGRSSLDALLANVIDPNQVVGKGYENVEVETKDGRSVSGRLVEDTDLH